ncbi:MAG: hypothetical protein J6S02_05280 [Bacteroidaceae bacterium]|nr:hypothetical protein [Bacteroidaceae bacterium]
MKKKYIVPSLDLFDFEPEHIATLSRMDMNEEGGEDQILTNKRQENWSQKPGWSNPAPWEE